MENNKIVHFTVLLEKLLWSCPDIGNIYIMLRQKKGKDSFSRIDDLIDTPVIDKNSTRTTSMFYVTLLLIVLNF